MIMRYDHHCGCTAKSAMPVLCGHPTEAEVQPSIWSRRRTCTVPGIWRACAPVGKPTDRCLGMPLSWG